MKRRPANLLALGRPRDRLPGEIDWWFLTPEKSDQFANDIVRCCIEDEAPGYANSMMFVAVQWHTQQRLALSAAMLRALACVFGLANLSNSGAVPARPLRALLGLPTCNDLIAFMEAARELGESGGRLTNSELGRLVGVGHNTIGKWRPDLARFTDAGADFFFPFGLNGVPADPGLVAEGGKHTVLDDIADALARRASSRLAEGKRRRLAMPAIEAEKRVTMWRIALHYSRDGAPVPFQYLRPLAHMLGLLSPVNGRPLPAPALLEAIGLPGDVENQVLFIKGAKLDGEALARTVGTSASVELTQGLVEQMMADNQWARSEHGLSTALCIGSTATLRSWRRHPQYQLLAGAAALLPSLSIRAWSNFNRRPKR